MRLLIITLFALHAATAASDQAQKIRQVPAEPRSLTGTDGTEHVPLAQSGGNINSTAQYNVGAYGAKCDGVTDDSAAFNSVLSAIRAGPYIGTFRSDWANGYTAAIITPRSSTGCLIKETLNATIIRGGGIVWDGNGTALVCQTNGAPCIDASGAENVLFSGLNIYGSSTRTPNIGLALGRASLSNPAADHQDLEHVTIGGYFTLTSYYNQQSETTLVTAGNFTNFYASTGTGSSGTYAMILDGENHFAFSTIATGGPWPANKTISLNETACIECVVSVWGAGDVPLWIGGLTTRTKFVTSYVFNWTKAATPAEPAVIIYAPFTHISQTFLDLDIHFENVTSNQSMSSILMFAGYPNITISGLYLRDPGPQQSGPIFARDSGGTYGSAVSTVTINDARIEVGILAGTSPSWFDKPAAFSINGYVYDQDGSWIFPGAFSGQICIASAPCSFTYGQLSAGGIAFTISSGTGACATTSTLVGGAVAGSFKCTGTAGSSTATITLPSAAHGYHCSASDATAGVAWANEIGSATTGKIAGSVTTSGDTISFDCMGY